MLLRLTLVSFFLGVVGLNAVERVRYIIPEQQRAYEEWSKTHPGVQIPPKKKTLSAKSSLTIGNILKSKATYTKVIPSTDDKTETPKTPTKTKPPVVKPLPTVKISKPPSRDIDINSTYKINEVELSGWFWTEELGWIYVTMKTYPYFYLGTAKKWVKLYIK